MHKVIEYISEYGREVSGDNNKEGSDILVSLTYIGKNREKDNGIKLLRAFETARKNDEKSGVTSALVLNDHYFIQNIEGTRLAINELITRVTSERPHLLSHVVDFEEIETRRWHGFLIKYLTSGSEDETHSLTHFSTGTDFNPYVMKKEQITGFLKAVFAQESS